MISVDKCKHILNQHFCLFMIFVIKQVDPKDIVGGIKATEEDEGSDDRFYNLSEFIVKHADKYAPLTNNFEWDLLMDSNGIATSLKNNIYNNAFGLMNNVHRRIIEVPASQKYRDYYRHFVSSDEAKAAILFLAQQTEFNHFPPNEDGSLTEVGEVKNCYEYFKSFHLFQSILLYGSRPEKDYVIKVPYQFHPQMIKKSLNSNIKEQQDIFDWSEVEKLNKKDTLLKSLGVANADEIKGLTMAQRRLYFACCCMIDNFGGVTTYSQLLLYLGYKSDRNRTTNIRIEKINKDFEELEKLRPIKLNRATKEIRSAPKKENKKYYDEKLLYVTKELIKRDENYVSPVSKSKAGQSIKFSSPARELKHSGYITINFLSTLFLTKNTVKATPKTQEILDQFLYDLHLKMNTLHTVDTGFTGKDAITLPEFIRENVNSTKEKKRNRVRKYIEIIQIALEFSGFTSSLTQYDTAIELVKRTEHFEPIGRALKIDPIEQTMGLENGKNKFSKPEEKKALNFYQNKSSDLKETAN